MDTLLSQQAPREHQLSGWMDGRTDKGREDGTTFCGGGSIPTMTMGITTPVTTNTEALGRAYVGAGPGGEPAPHAAGPLLPQD